MRKHIFWILYTVSLLLATASITSYSGLSIRVRVHRAYVGTLGPRFFVGYFSSPTMATTVIYSDAPRTPSDYFLPAYNFGSYKILGIPWSWALVTWPLLAFLLYKRYHHPPLSQHFPIESLQSPERTTSPPNLDTSLPQAILPSVTSAPEQNHVPQ